MEGLASWPAGRGRTVTDSLAKPPSRRTVSVSTLPGAARATRSSNASGERIGWPRGENDREIFTVGNARPLDQALQHATTEMTRWLMRGYGLDAGAAATILGQCVEYDIANVYDPAYSVACKVPKAMLAMVGDRTPRAAAPHGARCPRL